MRMVNINYTTFPFFLPQNLKVSFIASGYGRSEGVVVLLLQKSTEALRSYGSLVHADARLCMDKAINFIKPSDDSIRDFFKSFYESCKVSPTQISYLEADGSACKVFLTVIKPL